MDALPQDDFLLRQREKLLANAAWIQRQQLQLQAQRGILPNDGDDSKNDFVADTGKSVDPNINTPRQPQQEEPPQQQQEYCGEEGAQNTAGTSSPGPRQPSVGSASVRTPSHRQGVDGKSPGALRSCAGCPDSFVTLRGGSALRVQQRNTLWQLRREQKLEEQRMLNVEDFSEYTFSPELCRHPGNAPAPGAAAASPGVERFVQRHRRARQLACEKEARGRGDGSKWTYSLTVAEPFLLGQRQVVDALRPPVQGVPGTVCELIAPQDLEPPRTATGTPVIISTAAPRGAATTTTSFSPLISSSFSLEAVAAEAGVVLPPRGAFSSWCALQFCGSEQSTDVRTTPC
ncbi:hypothetical protein DQ04_00901140 [Trypanosoma grayi]|uniref:hypothetical protein n=1 Tax=Trypanosoma grayi TaxID=71804 RepID=UPI0004F48968|nr:hypothetical protein DQ04_00901140 [Trypanosoma grayi]KEG13612.1 hypothetical protein DQ04_00901140 [Trypanosoma grayi]